MIELQVPAGVRGVMTTREGGISKGDYASLNLGTHVEDDPVKVEFNRARLTQRLGVPLAWMNQVHGVDCVYRSAAANIPTADAQWTDQSQVALCVGVADCLPVGLLRRDGSAVAVAHAGWRGLAAGVIESAAEPLGGDLQAILGPCIGPTNFQVGPEVREAFVEQEASWQRYFSPDRDDRFLADLRGLARARLDRLGIPVIQDIDQCTVEHQDTWFSYRRQPPGGRMAMILWLA